MKTLYTLALLLALSPTLSQAEPPSKPGGRESEAVARSECQRLAHSTSARVLVIAFEGLASFSPAATQSAYRYHYQLSHGLNAQKPGGAMAGFVVNGTMIPVIEKFKGSIEFLAFPFHAQTNAPGSVPQVCAEEWMRSGNRKLVVIGHSFGGDAAVQLMDNLASRQVPVELTVTLDPVPKTGHGPGSIHVTRNAKRWVNYYQRSILPMGRSLDAAAVNERLPVGHVRVPYHPVAIRAVEEGISQAVSAR